jgi:hypothetical protein
MTGNPTPFRPVMARHPGFSRWRMTDRFPMCRDKVSLGGVVLIDPAHARLCFRTAVSFNPASVRGFERGHPHMMGAAVFGIDSLTRYGKCRNHRRTGQDYNDTPHFYSLLPIFSKATAWSIPLPAVMNRFRAPPKRVDRLRTKASLSHSLY